MEKSTNGPLNKQLANVNITDNLSPVPDECVGLRPVGRWRWDGRINATAVVVGGSASCNTRPTKRRVVLLLLLLLLLYLLLPVPVEQQESKPVLLHRGLVGRWRWPVLEFWIHHGRVGMVRSAISGRDSRQEPPSGRLNWSDTSRSTYATSQRSAAFSILCP